MEEAKQRILQKVRELFFKRGFSKVTMDELAAELGMSKKTLYIHFRNKTEMLETVVENLKQELANGVDQILISEERTFHEKMADILSFIGHTLGNMRPEFLVDLKKILPEINNELHAYKKEAAFSRFSNLLDEGIKKGYVREDINKSMAVLLYAAILDIVISPEYFSQIPEHLKQQIPYQSAEIYKGLVEVMLVGILK